MRTHHLLRKWRLQLPSCKHGVELSVRVPAPLPPVRGALRVGVPPLHSYLPAPGSGSTPSTCSRNTYRMNKWIIAANAADHLLWARLRAKHRLTSPPPTPQLGRNGGGGAGLTSTPRPCGSGADLPPCSLTRAGARVGSAGGTHLQRMLLQLIHEESVAGGVDMAAGRIQGFSALCKGRGASTPGLWQVPLAGRQVVSSPPD